MGVWWTIPTTFLSGPAAAGSIALINSCGNLGGWVGPFMMGWIKTNTGSFDLGYYLMGAFMCGAGLLVLTIRRGKDSYQLSNYIKAHKKAAARNGTHSCSSLFLRSFLLISQRVRDQDEDNARDAEYTRNKRLEEGDLDADAKEINPP